MDSTRISTLPNTKQVVNLLYHMERDWKTAIDISAQLHGVVLVIGPPGSGKSTLIKHLIGNNEKLIAESVPDANTTFTIADQDSLAGKKIYAASGIPLIVEHQFDLYIECPQFSDEGTLLSDVATSFAINSLIYNASSFKILFVCDHEAMKTVGYNSDLWLMLHRAAKFMKNISTISSIGLVVTKVSVPATPKPLPDEVVIDELVSNLLSMETIAAADDALLELESDEQRLLEEQQLQSIIFKLIAFFSKKAKVTSKRLIGRKKFKTFYTNVALFRQPDQTGPLAKSKSLQTGKEKIRQMITRLDKFLLEDFLFTFAIRRLTKEELLHIADRCHYVVSVKITDKISEYFEQKILDCDNVYELDEMLDTEHKNLQNVIDYISRQSRNSVIPIDPGSSEEAYYVELKEKFFFHDIVEFHRMVMTFLHSDGDSGKETELLFRLKASLAVIREKFPKWKVATRLIRYVIETLSEHTFQCNRHLFNVSDLNNWGSGEIGGSSGICVTPENFDQFFQDILRFRKCQLSDFSEKPLDLDYLNRVLADLLGDRLLTFDKNRQMFVGRNLVLLLGHRGAGKSAFVQYLLGSGSKMKVRTGDSTSFDDFGDRIGDEKSLFPKTTFPDIIKVGPNVDYVDLPPMHDVTSFDNELEIMLALKALLDNAGSVKLIFIADSASLRSEQSVQFLQTMTHATKFIDNLEKYTFGMCMVVTKVDSTLTPKAWLQNLDVELTNIENTVAANVDSGDNKKMLRLMRILFSKSKGQYTRLGWFYRPDKKSPELLQNGMGQLEKLIEATPFIKPQKSDFVLVVSNKSRIQILSVLVGTFIGDHYKGLFQEADCDLYDLDQKMKSLCDSFVAIKLDSTAVDEYSIVDVGNYLVQVFKESHIDEGTLHQFVAQTTVENASGLLQIVWDSVKEDTKRRIQMCRHGFDAIAEYFSQVAKFTNFFIKVEKVLGSYDVQAKKRLFNNSGQAVTAVNFKERLNQMNGRENFTSNEVPLDEDPMRTQHIEKLISTTLDPTITVTRTGDHRVEVTGHFVLCNDISDEDLEDGFELHIFATNAIYIDKPINSSVNLKKIVIIAPVVELRSQVSGMADLFIVCRHFHYIERGVTKYQPGVFGVWSAENDTSELFHSFNVCSKTTISEYKQFFFDHLDQQRSNSFQTRKLRLFGDFIDEEFMKFMVERFGNDYEKDKYLLLKCLIQQLQFLEILFFQARFVKNLLYWYQHLIEQVLTHPYFASVDSGQKQILYYLQVALATKINSLQYSSEHTLILDCRDYLDSVRSSIKSYEKEKVMKSVRTIQHTYKHAMDEKISEGQKFIDDQISTRIENVFHEIENNMSKLFDEITGLEQSTQNNKNELKEKLDNLKETIVMRNIFDTLRGMNKVMALCGVMGQSVSMLIDSGLNLTEAITLPYHDVNDIPKNELPACMDEALQMNEVLLLEMRNQSIESLQTQLTILLESVENLPTTNGRLEGSLESMKNDLQNFRAETMSNRMTDGQIANAQFAINQITHDLARVLEKDGTGDHIRQMSRINVGIVWARVMEFQKQNMITNAIESINEDLKKLERFREKINQTMMPAMKNMQAACLNARNDLSKLSEIALIMKNWQLKNVFNQFRNFSTIFTQGFKMHDRMIDCLQQMEEALCVTMQVFDRIQSFQSRKEIVDYFGKISTAGNRNYDITGDEVLNEAIMDVSMIIKSNIILEQYQRGLNGFKQWVFPFAKAYLADIQVPSKLDVPHRQNFQERCSELVENAVANIQQIQARTAEHSSSIMSLRDQCVHKCAFDEHNLKSAFFVWPFERYSQWILALLKGEEITLMSDVNSGIDDDAVKFSVVQLTFDAGNKQQQSLLNQYLQDSMISLTHCGNSYYRFRDQVYLIATESVKIRYSFNKGKDGKPLVTNEVYDKLSKHEPVLSPYTNWKLKITPQKEFKEIDWTGMRIDVKLTGHGQFLDNKELASLEVEKNYSLYNYSNNETSMELSRL